MASSQVNTLPVREHGRISADLATDHPCYACEARRVSMFYALECGHLSNLREIGTTRALEAGSPLFHQGDDPDFVYTVASGSLRLYRLLFDGRRQIIGFALPGEFLGISTEDVHEVTAEPMEPSRIWCFQRSRFETFVEENPILKDALLGEARKELAAARQQFIVLGRKTAMERVATFLLYFHDRLQRIPGHATNHVTLPMSRSDIADHLGLTKETISRVFSQLRNSRVMRLKSLSCIQILDRPALEILAEGDI